MADDQQELKCEGCGQEIAKIDMATATREQLNQALDEIAGNLTHWIDAKFGRSTAFVVLLAGDRGEYRAMVTGHIAHVEKCVPHFLRVAADEIDKGQKEW